MTDQTAKAEERARLVERFMAGEIDWKTFISVWEPREGEQITHPSKEDQLNWTRTSLASLQNDRTRLEVWREIDKSIKETLQAAETHLQDEKITPKQRGIYEHLKTELLSHTEDAAKHVEELDQVEELEKKITEFGCKVSAMEENGHEYKQRPEIRP